MKARKKAEELIADYLQMQPNGSENLEIELSKQYKFAKLQAQYTCHVAKWSHKKESKKFNFWQEVKEEINKL